MVRIQSALFTGGRVHGLFRDAEAIAEAVLRPGDGTDDEKICACLHFIDMDVKKKDALARMNVALIKEQGKKRSRPLRVVNEPFKECLGYAALRGLPPVQDTDHELCALLAKLSIVQIVPVAVI